MEYRLKKVLPAGMLESIVIGPRCSPRSAVRALGARASRGEHQPRVAGARVPGGARGPEARDAPGAIKAATSGADTASTPSSERTRPCTRPRSRGCSCSRSPRTIVKLGGSTTTPAKIAAIEDAETSSAGAHREGDRESEARQGEDRTRGAGDLESVQALELAFETDVKDIGAADAAAAVEEADDLHARIAAAAEVMVEKTAEAAARAPDAERCAKPALERALDDATLGLGAFGDDEIAVLKARLQQEAGIRRRDNTRVRPKAAKRASLQMEALAAAAAVLARADAKAEADPPRRSFGRREGARGPARWRRRSNFVAKAKAAAEAQLIGGALAEGGRGTSARVERGAEGDGYGRAGLGGSARRGEEGCRLHEPPLRTLDGVAPAEAPPVRREGAGGAGASTARCRHGERRGGARRDAIARQRLPRSPPRRICPAPPDAAAARETAAPPRPPCRSHRAAAAEGARPSRPQEGLRPAGLPVTRGRGLAAAVDDRLKALETLHRARSRRSPEHSATASARLRRGLRCSPSRRARRASDASCSARSKLGAASTAGAQRAMLSLDLAVSREASSMVELITAKAAEVCSPCSADPRMIVAQARAGRPPGARSRRSSGRAAAATEERRARSRSRWRRRSARTHVGAHRRRESAPSAGARRTRFSPSSSRAGKPTAR